MEINVTDRYTELYVGGGGNWITQSTPTHYHNFWKSKMLTPTESADMFKEVTTAQKEQIEKEDAAFVPPSQELIDWWRICFDGDGRYNPDTGYFEAYNEVNDITVSEAEYVRRVSDTTLKNNISSIYEHTFGRCPRVIPPIMACGIDHNLGSIFQNGNSLEAIGFRTYWTWQDNMLRVWAYGTNLSIFYNCKNLRKIANPIHIRIGNWYNSLKGCTALREVRIASAIDISFAESPAISYESVKYSLMNAFADAERKMSTLTLHQTTYGKIMDEDNAEWHSLLELAAEKGITIATI